MNFLLLCLSRLRSLDSSGYMLTVGLRRDGNTFNAARFKRQFAYHFCTNRALRKIMRAQMAIDLAEDAAREYGTNEPLELPEIKRLKELLPK